MQPDERALGLKILEQLYPASRCTIIDRMTFNHRGKTDILIRVDGKNIFIAE